MARTYGWRRERASTRTWQQSTKTSLNRSANPTMYPIRCLSTGDDGWVLLGKAMVTEERRRALDVKSMRCGEKRPRLNE